MSNDDLAGMDVDNILEEGLGRSRRKPRVSYVEVDPVFSEEEEEETKKEKKKQGPKQGSSRKSRTKECPGCAAELQTSIKICPFCDLEFSSKSMIVTQAMMVEESDKIREMFPFEPTREEDGSLKVHLILGRRLRKQGRRWVRSNAHGESALFATDEKYNYEYLIKFKDLSYMHTKWESATEIDAMNSSSKKVLMRYLSRLDKGDPECPDEPDVDPTWTEVEKVLDVREDEVCILINIQEALKIFTWY